jgi:hypothetical protein
MVERQREVERALSEQRQKEEEKVRRSEALAAQLKNKEVGAVHQTTAQQGPAC